jgi:hypothetical protein
LAIELGVSPGPELVATYEALIREEGTASKAASGFDPVILADRCTAEAEAARARGDTADAVRLFVEAARNARDAGDVRRFAEAALGAAGDGWRTSLDATDEIVVLLSEALERVPAGPTSLRARLLARSAITQSHHRPAAESEVTATKALAIARATDDQRAIAYAVHALCVVVWDPQRREQHGKWVDELAARGADRPDEPWSRWALPIVARVRAREGDIPGACDALDQLACAASCSGDRGDVYDASYVGVLRASVAGDWSTARMNAHAVRAAADEALFDPAVGALLEMGMLRVFDLLAGPTNVPALTPIDWPMPSIALTARAWYADCLARTGRLAAARAELAAIDPASIGDVDRDAYWLAILSMLADAAHITSDAQTGKALWGCLEPVTDLSIFDPGLVYRGSAAHSAGLAAAACGRHRDAADLLAIGLAKHEAHGSPWMVERSRHAIAALTND